MKRLKTVLLVVMGVLFFLPWYPGVEGSLVGDTPLNGWMVPGTMEDIAIINILYLTPLFVIVGLVRSLMGKTPRFSMALAGAPVAVFWILLFLSGSGGDVWYFAYITGKWCFYLSVIMVILPFATGKNNAAAKQPTNQHMD